MAQSNDREIDALLERYKRLRLIYFPHWKVTPWEKREKEAAVQAFLDDLEAFLVKKGWTKETSNENLRIYRPSDDPELFLRIRNYIDYFGVHTVYLVEMHLVRDRPLLWGKTVADGELVFDRLRGMA